MIRWLTAFLDIPADRFDRSVEFWTAVTSTAPSAPRGEAGEFASFLSATGDSYLRIQRTTEQNIRVHLDLHVNAPSEAAARALPLGANELHRENHVVMASPAGVVFCFVGYHGEAQVPAAHALPGGPPCRVNQVSIDIPYDSFDAEIAFWTELTGWDAFHDGGRPEYRDLAVPDELPLGIIFQRLEPDSPADTASLHIDVGCGNAITEAAAAHEHLGASKVTAVGSWTVMTDPAGMTYCLVSSAP